MKRVAPAIIRRAASAIARKPRTRTEAAVELVRAEFERERLDRDIALLGRRAAISKESRDAAMLRSRTLRARLSEGDGVPVAPKATALKDTRPKETRP